MRATSTAGQSYRNSPVKSRRSPFRRSRSPWPVVLLAIPLLALVLGGGLMWLNHAWPDLVPLPWSDGDTTVPSANGAAPGNARSDAASTATGDTPPATLAATAPPPPAVFSGPARIIDGDTLELDGTRIGLEGIDALELGQECQRDGQTHRCGEIAATALRERIGTRRITCLEFDREDNGRVLARCWVGRDELNRWMVREGFALADRSHSGEYVPDEEFAHIAGIGVWSGTFQPPWEYRKAHGGR